MTFLNEDWGVKTVFYLSEPACQEVTKLVEEEVEENVCKTVEEEVCKDNVEEVCVDKEEEECKLWVSGE